VDGGSGIRTEIIQLVTDLRSSKHHIWLAANPFRKAGLALAFVLVLTSGTSNASNIAVWPNGEVDIVNEDNIGQINYYWNTRGSPYWDRTVIAGPGSAEYPEAGILAMNIARRPTGEIDVIVQARDGHIEFYSKMPGSLSWNAAAVTSRGAAGSAPAIAIRPSGEAVVVVGGADGHIECYSNKPGSSSWNSSMVAGPRAAGSAPAIAIRPDGEVVVAARAADGHIGIYWNTPGSSSWGSATVAGPGAAVASPAIAVRPDDEAVVVAQASDGHIKFYWNKRGSPSWDSIVIPGPRVFSNPTLALRPDDEAVVVAQASDGHIEFYWNKRGSPSWDSEPIPGPGASDPALALRHDGEAIVVANHALNGHVEFYWNTRGSTSWHSIAVDTALRPSPSPAASKNPGPPLNSSICEIDTANHYTTTRGPEGTSCSCPTVCGVPASGRRVSSWNGPVTNCPAGFNYGCP
jgi:WD40 repeat protein